MTSKADWLEWKTSPITKAFFGTINERRENVKEILIQQAGRDSINDSELVGYARALVDVLGTDFEELDDDAGTVGT